MICYFKHLFFGLFCATNVFLCNFTDASELIFLAGARETGLANSGVSLGGLWSVYHNPAGMAVVNQTSFGISYENRYMVNDLNIATCAAVIPVQKGAFGAACSYFGTTRYNEKKYALGYAHALTDKLSAGILFDYFSIALPENYDDCMTIAGEAGILARPIKKLTIGMHIANITGSFHKAFPDNDVPQFFRTGASWKEENYTITSQIQMGKNQESIVSAAAEINLLKKMAIRIGASTNESTNLTFGFGYITQNIQADIAFVHHSVLGLSSSFSILFRISKQ